MLGKAVPAHPRISIGPADFELPEFIDPPVAVMKALRLPIVGQDNKAGHSDPR
jgi:hypothetical protein